MAKASRDKADRFLRHLEPLQGALEAFCRRFLDRMDDVADVLQSAVANAYRDFDLYAEGTNFRAWMFRYVHLEALNRNRAARRRLPAATEAASSGEPAWQFMLDEPLFKMLLDDPEPVLDQCDAVLAATLKGLEPTDRGVFLLRAIGEFKYREIADILQIPIGSVMSTLARTRLRLQQQLVQFAAERGIIQGELES
jgi:RNA polymerase sigma-70 factor (ECF subfamily)